MDFDFEQEIIKVLEQTRDEIRANMERHNINASGRTSDGFQVVRNEKGFALQLDHSDRTAPLATLEVGRGPGGVPGGFTGVIKSGKHLGKPDVSKLFRYVLIRWAESKGLADFGWGQATVAARKIAYEGTDRRQKPVDIYSTPVQEAKQKLNDVVASSVAKTIKAAVYGMKTTSVRGAFAT